MRVLLMVALLAGCQDNGTNTPYNTPSELMLIDLDGTWYTAGSVAWPRTHLLFHQTHLPEVGGYPLYEDPDWSPTSGCSVNQYNENAAPSPTPNPDQPAGLVG